MTAKPARLRRAAKGKRFQVRLLTEFDLMQGDRFQHSSFLINEIVKELGGWLKQQKAL